MSLISQNILSDHRYPRTIIVRQVLADDAACQLTQSSVVSPNVDTIFIGISYHISETGNPDFICLASLTHAFTISVGSKMRTGSKSFAALLRSGITHDTSASSPGIELCLVGFGMARIAVQVRQATGLQIRGVDLSSLSNLWEPWSPSKFIAERVDAKVDKFAVAHLWMGDQDSSERDVALQAWLAACAATRCESVVKTAGRVDTQYLNSSEQPCLSLLVAQSDLLEWNKPQEVPNDFSCGGMNKQGKYEIHNSRYKTRLRRGDQCRVVLTDMKGHEFVGSVRQMRGKRTTIALQNQKHPGEGLRHVKVVGRPDPTNSEKAQNKLILLVMMGTKSLRDSPFIRMVWFPHWKPMNVEPIIVCPQDADHIMKRIGLNESQRTSVHTMVGASPLIVVHGPPGTGKTTTIAAASRIWDLSGLPVWIVAHSNVAVKNIAETLFKREVNFKLLVSKEFYEEWHEHLYREIEEKLIRSDELPRQKIDMERVIADSRIILCTLSMISNPALDENGTFEIVPFNRLVIDEASQINAFEFMHIFERFQNVLEKVCFFGDPNQLPPYGYDNVPEMKTIFEFDHLKQAGIVQFLNIQYRMPKPIANFISHFLYNRRLLSQHPVDSSDCLAFIDASQTGEERAGFSSRNQGEVDTVVHLMRNYYRWKNVCIITPYDAQRAAIQKRLEDEKLPWEAVYNVDSFQGNEADYVIVSVVRSAHSGFLRSRNRMNVLLTRCRKGLIIVSNRLFLDTGSGSDTLLGRLVAYWQSNYPQRGWIGWRSVAGAVVDLPGVAGTKALPSAKTHPSTICFLTMNDTPSFNQKLISPSDRQLKSQTDQTTYANVASFPPLISKQPLLSGRWGTSAFQTVYPLSLVHRRHDQPDATATHAHPLSLVHRRGQVPDATAKESLFQPPVTRISTSVNLNNHLSTNSGKKTTTAKQPKRFQVPKSHSAGGPKQTPKPEISSQSTGFIRSVTVYSRNSNGITNTKR